jgi:hypothetical protein
LAQASGAEVAAASSRVGTAALGGSWELQSRANAASPQAPLTAAGKESYTGVFAVSDVTVSGTLPSGETTAAVNYFIMDMATKTVVGYLVLPNATKLTTKVLITVKVPSASASYSIGTFTEGGEFQPASFLTVSRTSGVQHSTGAVGREQR